ncbi:RNA ligase/cyclic nucleotide phosphodiesterase [Lipomyces oligophaga]|uniref:RNA ligase/cyclic nucleotide phosphodiesterase n=1 Tax=Lipomyces oligophaga TaxID=45792 RepID=UPI0034CD251A
MAATISVHDQLGLRSSTTRRPSTRSQTQSQIQVQSQNQSQAQTQFQKSNLNSNPRVASSSPARLAAAAPQSPVAAYEAFITAYPTPSAMSQAYDLHRRRRNLDQRARIVAAAAINPDPILSGLVLDHQPPEFDPRNCISLWARPPSNIRNLVANIQRQLLLVEPDLWCMPQDCLHMTALEVIHSSSSAHVASALSLLTPILESLLAPYPAPSLVRPILSYDQNALALSFLPSDDISSAHSSWYSYHHLRRDLARICARAGVPAESRYIYPSAHVTIARFVKPLSCSIEDWLYSIDSINSWLDSSYSLDSSWTVATERGLECRCGRIWYGGGYAQATGPSLTQSDLSLSSSSLDRSTLLD